jgi:2-polyprenyl-3-methyl-5-hydroxy-6-metoxy-1,4-benzoquinol methylase
MNSLKSIFTAPIDFSKPTVLNNIYSYKSVELAHMHKMRIYLFSQLIERLIAKGTIKNFESAVDIGCNNGVYSKLLSEFGFKSVLGIDIEPEMIKVAKKNFESSTYGSQITFEVQNAEEFDRPNQFDLVLCTEVIEHTNNQKKTIENIRRLLKKDGIAIITLPNVVSLPYLLTWLSYKVQNRKFDKEMIDHLSYPFYKSIRLFKDKPYKVIQVTGTNLFYWHFLHRFPAFNFLNKINFKLGKLWPFKFFTQYFYVVLQN